MMSSEMLDLDNDVSVTPSERDRKIFLGGLSWLTSEESILHYFNSIGEDIDRVVIMREKLTGRSRGFGFIIASDSNAVERIVRPSLTHVIDGKKIEAKKAIPKAEMNNPAKKIFVGGVALTVDDEQFRGYFEAFGQVVESQIIRDRISTRSRGFGFVTFLTETSVDAVLAQRHTIQGKEVEVKMAEPRKAQPVVHHVIQPVLVAAGYPLNLPQGAYGLPLPPSPYHPDPDALSPPQSAKNGSRPATAPSATGSGRARSLVVQDPNSAQNYWIEGEPLSNSNGGNPRRGDGRNVVGKGRTNGSESIPIPIQGKHRDDMFLRARNVDDEASGSPSDLDLSSLQISALPSDLFTNDPVSHHGDTGMGVLGPELFPPIGPMGPLVAYPHKMGMRSYMPGPGRLPSLVGYPGAQPPIGRYPESTFAPYDHLISITPTDRPQGAEDELYEVAYLALNPPKSGAGQDSREVYSDPNVGLDAYGCLIISTKHISSTHCFEQPSLTDSSGDWGYVPVHYSAQRFAASGGAFEYTTDARRGQASLGSSETSGQW